MSAPQQHDTPTVHRLLSLVGTVHDEQTSTPIGGAVVELVAGPAAFEALRATLARDPVWTARDERLDRRLSRADGLFFFIGLPDGTYQLKASAPLLNGRYGSAEIAIEARLGRDARGRLQYATAELRLPPTRLSGKVVDKDGKPIAGARVRLRGDEREIRTDDGGTYELIGVLPGQPTVLAAAAGFEAGFQATSVRAGQVRKVDDLVLAPAKP